MGLRDVFRRRADPVAARVDLGGSIRRGVIAKKADDVAALAAKVPDVAALALRTGDMQGARKWWERAAGGGSVDAMYFLGDSLDDVGDLAGARKWLEKAARAGHADAKGTLGYVLGKQGERVLARAWDTEAAEAGVTFAMHNLGVLHLQSGDVESAQDWFTKAAKVGYVPAMVPLGALAYDSGELRRARMWWERAAKAGSLDANANLEIVLSEIRAQEDAPATAVGAIDQGRDLLQPAAQHQGAGDGLDAQPLDVPPDGTVSTHEQPKEVHTDRGEDPRPQAGAGASASETVREHADLASQGHPTHGALDAKAAESQEGSPGTDALGTGPPLTRDQLFLRAGAEAVGRGWADFEVIDAGDMSTVSPHGDPLIVVAESLDLAAAQTIATLVGAGRSVAVIAGRVEPNAVRWLPEAARPTALPS